jgi:hypothetical protein
VRGPEDAWQPGLFGTRLVASLGEEDPEALQGVDTLFLPQPSAPPYEGFSVETGQGGMSMAVPFAPVVRNGRLYVVGRDEPDVERVHVFRIEK